MNFDIYILSKDGSYSSRLYYKSKIKRRYSFQPKWTNNIKHASIWATKQYPKQLIKRFLKENPFDRPSDYSIIRFTAVYQSEDINEEMTKCQE